MKFNAIHRGSNVALKLAALGAVCFISLSAAASENPLVEQQADAPTLAVATMAPIPNNVVPPASARYAGERKATASARHSEMNCLATAVYFEARGETARGQSAVAEVILTRTRARGRPKTICGVVYEGSRRSTGCQFSFTCDRVPDAVRDDSAWSRAQKIAKAVMRTRGKGKSIARGATNYHANYVTPYWASHMVKVAEVGTHIFYR